MPRDRDDPAAGPANLLVDPMAVAEVAGEASPLSGRSETTDGRLGFQSRQGRSGVRGAWGKIRHALAAELTDAEIPARRGGNPDFPTLEHTEWGDSLSVGELIKLADPRGPEVILSAVGEEGLVRRERGGVLSVSIEYSNFQNFDLFGFAEPMYFLSARLLPLQWLYQWREAPHEGENGERVLEGHQGFLVTARVHGHLREFDLQCLLAEVVTSLLMLALVVTVLDVVMAHCTELAQHRGVLTYQPPDHAGKLRGVVQELLQEQEQEQEFMQEGGASHAEEDDEEDGDFDRGGRGQPPAATAKSGASKDLLAVLERIERRLQEDRGGSVGAGSAGSYDRAPVRDGEEQFRRAEHESFVPGHFWPSGSVRTAPL